MSIQVNIKIHSEFRQDLQNLLDKYQESSKDDLATRMDYGFLQGFLALHYQGDFKTIGEFHKLMKKVVDKKQKELKI